MQLSELNRAFAFASRAHEGQVDKGGLPYILHPMYVSSRAACMAAMQGFGAHGIEVCAMAGMLHDVVEDTEISIEMIEAEFGRDVSYEVNLLTKRVAERNDDYYLRVALSDLATLVKLADIEHNSSPDRMAMLDMRDQIRLQGQYGKYRAFLLAACKTKFIDKRDLLK